MKQASFTIVAALVAWLLLGSTAMAADNSAIRAKAAYEKGKAQYAAGSYEEALTQFTAAYNLSSRPALLYNLGLCAEQLGDKVRAIAYFRLYLEELPNADDAKEVKTRIATMEAAAAPVAPPTPVPVPVVAAPPPPLPPEYSVVEARPGRRSSSLGPGLLTGLGSLVLASGVVTAIGAATRYNGLEASCAPSCSSAEVDGARAAAIAADVQMFVGGAAAVAGVTWLLVKRNRKQAAERPTAFQFGVLPTGFVLSGRWL